MFGSEIDAPSYHQAYCGVFDFVPPMTRYAHSTLERLRLQAGESSPSRKSRELVRSLQESSTAMPFVSIYSADALLRSGQRSEALRAIAPLNERFHEDWTDNPLHDTFWKGLLRLVRGEIDEFVEQIQILSKAKQTVWRHWVSTDPVCVAHLWLREDMQSVRDRVTAVLNQKRVRDN